MSSPVQPSFRKQLTSILTLGLMGLGVLTALLTSWVVTSRLESFVMETVSQITGRCALGAELAFLVDDPFVRRHAPTACRSLPGIRYAALLRRNYSVLAADGAPVAWTPRAHREGTQQGVALAGEDASYWHFLAPVGKTSPKRPYYEARPTPKRVHGYVHVVFEKRPLQLLEAGVFSVNILIAFGFCLFFIVWLRRRIGRLTEPLRALSDTMKRAQAGREQVRAPLTGPSEVREIASVFNRMMARIERHRSELESQVSMRTFELKQARDAALTAVRHKSDFLRTVTHEMRTLMHAVLGHAEAILSEVQFLDENDRELVTEPLTRLIDAATGLLVLITQLLEMAKVEAGKADIQLGEVDLAALVYEITEIVTPLRVRNGNRLGTELIGPATLIMDRDKVFHIILNLVTNACKFTQEGTIDLRVQHEDQLLAITVTDSGIGIASEHHDLIFETFQQVDMSGSRRYPGTGLGLAITKAFCELLGGDIVVESALGQGATFRVRLPLAIDFGIAPSIPV